MLLDRLKKHGITRVQLAEDAGVARSTLEAWAAGQAHPKPETLRRIASGLRRRAQTLLQLAEEVDQET